MAQLTTHTDNSEDALREARRKLIDQGATVSLITYNPTTDLYEFDAYRFKADA